MYAMYTVAPWRHERLSTQRVDQVNSVFYFDIIVPLVEG